MSDYVSRKTEYILEDFKTLDFTLEEAETLVRMGIIVHSDRWAHYEFTALVWDDLDLSTEQSFLLVESLLQYLRGELVNA